MKTILLKLAGPMQSWGTNSYFETRFTDMYPSKSGIIGMIAGSLGYKREEDEKIEELNDLVFAVRVDQEGILSKDYHIARKYKKNGDFERTYVTNRYYLEDAVFIVALSHKSQALIEKIIVGLTNPYFQPYLGRRSNPPTYDLVCAITDDGVIDSLKAFPWQASPWYQKKLLKDKPVELIIYADSDLLASREHYLRSDRVKSFSHKERKYGFRGESFLAVEAVGVEEHDIFGQIGG